jgi:TPR repeat protein
MRSVAWWGVGLLAFAVLPGCGKALGLVYDRCEKGDVSACERVRSLAERPCQRGEAKACFMLGDVYNAGKGGPKDPAKARDFFDQACERGYQPACTPTAAAPAPVAAQADAAALPAPVAAPAPAPAPPAKKAAPKAAAAGAPSKARAAMEARCRAGDAEACIDLGKMIRTNPTARDKAAAGEMIRRACAGKNAETCNQIRKELFGK